MTKTESIKAAILEAKFPLGGIYMTHGVDETLTFEEQMLGLSRHARGDWGDVCAEDRAENELSLREGYRLFSVYYSSKGTKFWIITEADRSSTTILLPEEY